MKDDIKCFSLLVEFIAGGLDLPTFRERLDDLLFELRQSPVMTPEKQCLSDIQLYFHEMDEGYREKADKVER